MLHSLQWPGIMLLLHRRHLLLITTDGGDGLLSLVFLFTMVGHTTAVITGIALTATIMVGITDKKGRVPRALITRQGFIPQTGHLGSRLQRHQTV